MEGVWHPARDHYKRPAASHRHSGTTLHSGNERDGPPACVGQHEGGQGAEESLGLGSRSEDQRAPAGWGQVTGREKEECVNTGLANAVCMWTWMSRKCMM